MVEIALLLTLALFVILILLEVPIALALTISGAIGIAMIEGLDVMISVVSSIPYTSVAGYSLFAIPMFILLGSFITHAEIADKIYRSAAMMTSRLPGGLAAATAAATSIFSGISGSSAADVATMGRISISEMRRYGYAPSYASAVVAAAGAFAALVPPSIGLVLYGILAEESIGAMLLAGIIPGAISGMILITYVIGRARRGDVTFGAVGPKIDRERYDRVDSAKSESSVNSVKRLNQVRIFVSGIAYASVLFAVVAGGIYSGIFTATEAGAVGAVASLFLGIIAVRFDIGRVRKIISLALIEASRLTSMIFLLIVGGAVLRYLIVLTRLPGRIAEWVTALAIPPSLVLVCFLLVLLPLGMMLDGLTILFLTVPIVAPIVQALGFDGVWFGVLIMKMIEISLITPPVGINCFIVAGIAPDVKVEQVFRAVTPFVVLDLLATALFFVVPSLVMWLPRAAGF